MLANNKGRKLLKGYAKQCQKEGKYYLPENYEETKASKGNKSVIKEMQINSIIYVCMFHSLFLNCFT